MVDGHPRFFHRQAQAVHRRLDDAHIGLVRHNPIKFPGLNSGFFTGLQQRLRHHLCRKFVDLAPAHDHMPGTFRTAVNSVLLRRVVGKGRGGRRVFAEHQAVAGPVRAKRSAVKRVCRANHRRAGAVAEQHACAAVLIISQAREDFRSYDQRVINIAAGKKAPRHIKPVNVSRARARDIITHRVFRADRTLNDTAHRGRCKISRY